MSAEGKYDVLSRCRLSEDKKEHRPRAFEMGAMASSLCRISFVSSTIVPPGGSGLVIELGAVRLYTSGVVSRYHLPERARARHAATWRTRVGVVNRREGVLWWWLTTILITLRRFAFFNVQPWQNRWCHMGRKYNYFGYLFNLLLLFVMDSGCLSWPTTLACPAAFTATGKCFRVTTPFFCANFTRKQY